MVNLPAKYTQKDTLRYKGGGHGGAYPLASLLAAVFAPQIGGATGIRDPPSRAPLGAMGTMGHGPKAMRKTNRIALGLAPRPMAPPFAGGGRYTRERLAGVHIYLGVPW